MDVVFGDVREQFEGFLVESDEHGPGDEIVEIWCGDQCRVVVVVFFDEDLDGFDLDGGEFDDLGVGLGFTEDVFEFEQDLLNDVSVDGEEVLFGIRGCV